MKPLIPYGGFFSAKYFDSPYGDLRQRLEQDSRCKSVFFENHNIILAAWAQFPGQGLWYGSDSAVAYDVDLTNLDSLTKLVGIPHDEPIDFGLLLWKLYQKYDQAFVDKLRGAFAFTLWDGRLKKLLVITDCYGIRPVVYTRQAHAFLAASRIRQLELAGIDREINPEAIYHYLFFQAICSPVSIYKNVHKLEPGKGVQFSDGESSEFSWYDLKYHPVSGKDENYWCQAIQTEVAKAVGHYVPERDVSRTGCFLSGGTDSSAVVGYYTKLTDKPVKTFSIGFDDPKYNELDYARIAADRYGSETYEYLVTPQDVLSLISELAEIYDEPMGNASVIAAYFCAKLAREHGVDLMLGGDGGDEIFGGNERYVTNLIFKRYADLPRFFRRSIFEPLLQSMPAKGLFYKAKRYVRRASMPNPRRFYSYNLLAEMDNKQIFQPDFLQQIDTDCFVQRAQHLYDQAAPAEETDRLLYLDMKFTITDNDLRKVSQMVEAAGIQVRYPLLDRDLVDFTCNIPPALKVKPGKNRYIFKQAMRGFLPDEIIHKTKHGMGLPIAKWLKEDSALNALLESMLFSGTAEITKFVKPDYLQKIKGSFYTEESPYFGDNLWVFLILELWLRKSGSQP